MTTAKTTHPALAAERVRLIRPGDAEGRAALRLLAHLMGARVERGSIRLAGRSHPALLAIRPSGETLAAALLDGDHDAITIATICPLLTRKDVYDDGDPD